MILLPSPVVRVLSSFKTLRAEGYSRVDYTKQLAVDLALYYGYNAYLTNIFMQVSFTLLSFPFSVCHCGVGLVKLLLMSR